MTTGLLLLAVSWGLAAGSLVRWVRERRAHRLSVEASERRFRSLVERSSDLVLLLSPEGYVHWASPSVETLLGLDGGALVGEDARALVHPEDAPRLDEAGSPRCKAVELRLCDSVGDWRWFDLELDDLTHEPSVAGVVARLRDATPRKFAEAALEEREAELRQASKMEAVGLLAGGIAHDFNNLLTAIQCAARLALDELEDADALRDDLEEILSAASSAAGLTRNLLAFGRKQVLSPESVALNDRVLSTERLVRRIIGEDIELSVVTDPRVGRVEVDSGQLDQVLVNLIVNARDAMPRGGKLRIATRPGFMPSAAPSRSEATSRCVPAAVITVTDTGSGMSEAVRARIFEPFFTTKSKHRGSGLGLSTVYGIVTQSGGHVEVDSELDVGTTFTLYLPLAQSVEPCTEGGNASREGRSRDPGTLSVLLVEDDEAVRGITSRILCRGGHRVVEAACPKEALRIAGERGNRFDVLVTDIVMPAMSGHALAEELTQVMPDLRILYMSGYAEEDILRKGLLFEGSAFIQKPFSPRGFLEQIERIALEEGLTGGAGAAA